MRGDFLSQSFGGFRKNVYLCTSLIDGEIMKLTKEEAVLRYKKALEKKKDWEAKFETKYSNVTNLYATA